MTPDWSSLATELVKALSIPALVAIVAGVRKLLPKIPRVALPILAVALGVVADWIVALVSGGQTTPLVGALLGTAAVWLRELGNTARQHGLDA